MKTLLIESGYTEKGIERFLYIIESAMPHMPGNWAFMSIEQKLSFIYKNKERVNSYIMNTMPVHLDHEMSIEMMFNDTVVEKNMRYKELKSAELTLRIIASYNPS